MIDFLRDNKVSISDYQVYDHPESIDDVSLTDRSGK